MQFAHEIVFMSRLRILMRQLLISIHHQILIIPQKVKFFTQITWHGNSIAELVSKQRRQSKNIVFLQCFAIPLLNRCLNNNFDLIDRQIVVIPLQNKYLNASANFAVQAHIVVIPLQNKYLNSSIELSKDAEDVVIYFQIKYLNNPNV